MNISSTTIIVITHAYLKYYIKRTITTKKIIMHITMITEWCIKKKGGNWFNNSLSSFIPTFKNTLKMIKTNKKISLKVWFPYTLLRKG